jgi:uncharacterized protein (DUF305 family)
MNVHAQMAHSHHGPSASPPPFIASSAKPLSELMNDAMAVMDDGMKRARVNGVTEHDFVTMMIPHHQGAIDMAKALLVYTNDPELKNLAQGIIREVVNSLAKRDVASSQILVMEGDAPADPAKAVLVSAK